MNNPLRTRADVQTMLRDLVRPLETHFSPGRAEVRLGETRGLFGDPAGWLEGFARPLWGIVPLLSGGGAFKQTRLWVEGLTAGTDPSHPEYWGVTGDYDQRSVEQAAIGFALALAPEHFWGPLPEKAKRRLSTWLQHINEVKLVSSNWLFFRVLVNLGLRRCQQPWSPEQIRADLDQIDQFYLGNGWYSDGKLVAPGFRDGRLGDYYVPMALHLYALIYARLASDLDPTRAARMVERARLFAKDFIYWFSADGSALPFGRSLTYRFAQASFWGGLAFAAVEALPWGVIKGVYLRHLRWWMQQPILTGDGLLSIGYGYPNLLMAESYNSSQSPYWALKAFLPLALPDSHPFWRAREEPLPSRRSVHSVPEAALIITIDPGRGGVTALTPGQKVFDWPRHAPHKYSKCSYSTEFGFNVPAGVATISEGGLDNGIAVSVDGRFYRPREHCEEAQLKDGVAFSRWMAWPDIEVWTWIIADTASHVRLHYVRNARKAWVVDGGFPLGYSDKRTLRFEVHGAAGATVRTPKGVSLIHSLHGDRRAECVELGANSSILSSLSAMPLLRSEHAPGVHWLAAFVAANPLSEQVFSEAARATLEIDATSALLLKDGAPWWSTALEKGTGVSSPGRLEQISRWV